MILKPKVTEAFAPADAFQFALLCLFQLTHSINQVFIKGLIHERT